MITVKDLREKLKDRRIPVIARETGLSRQAIYNIYYGITENPTFDTMQKLSIYFEAN